MRYTFKNISRRTAFCYTFFTLINEHVASTLVWKICTQDLNRVAYRICQNVRATDTSKLLATVFKNEKTWLEMYSNRSHKSFVVFSGWFSRSREIHLFVKSSFRQTRTIHQKHMTRSRTFFLHSYVRSTEKISTGWEWLELSAWTTECWRKSVFTLTKTTQLSLLLIAEVWTKIISVYIIRSTVDFKPFRTAIAALGCEIRHVHCNPSNNGTVFADTGLGHFKLGHIHITLQHCCAQHW